MIENLSKDEFRELYMKLPEDLQDAIFAPETGENIEAICKRNKIDELMGFMINKIGDVYLGLLPPDNLFADIEKQMEGKTGIKQIVLEIKNFLLYQYKESLEKVYQPQSAGIAAQTGPTTSATDPDTPNQIPA